MSNNNADNSQTTNSHVYTESNMETITELQIDPEKLNAMKSIKAENKNTNINQEKPIDKSTILLNVTNNQILDNLNNPIANEENNNNNKKSGFFSKTKSWLGKTWTNIKNYDYSKLNIFKGEEMEECLDAHGFPIKIPKRRHNQNPQNKEENKK